MRARGRVRARPAANPPPRDRDGSDPARSTGRVCDNRLPRARLPSGCRTPSSDASLLVSLWLGDPAAGLFEFQHPSSQILRALHLVEGVDVEPRDVVIPIPDVRGQTSYQFPRAIASGLEKLRNQVYVFGQEPRRAANADLQRDPQELLPLCDTRYPDVDGQIYPPTSDIRYPVQDRAGVEAHLADYVGSEGTLLQERPTESLIVDGGMAFGVPAYPDPLEAATRLRQRGEEFERARIRSGGLSRVATDDENLLNVQAFEPLRDLFEMRTSGHEPGGEVRHGLKTVAE